MPQINFGGMLGGNKSTLKGVASGVDSDSIINALVAKKERPLALHQDQIAFNSEKLVAFGDLASKMHTLEGALVNLKGLRFAEDGVNSLEEKAVSLFSTATATPQNYIDVDVNYTASLGNINVKVNAIAQNKILKSTTVADPNASATNPVADHTDLTKFTPGTFQINGDSITVALNDSLNTIVSKINSVSNSTNAMASVVYTGSNYVMMLQSTKTGLSNAFTITDASNVLNNNFIVGGSIVQAAADSSITINNSIQVTRSSNVIGDAIQGVTFHLHAPIATDVSVNVAYDVNKAADALETFVNGYNDFIKFATQQQGVDDNGNYYDTAKIRHNDFLANLRHEVVELTASLAYISSSSRGVGIHYLDEVPANPATNEPAYHDLISFDRSEFTAAFNADPGRVQELFEFKGSSDSTNYMFYKRGSKIDALSFAIDLDITRTTLDRVRITYGATTINGTFVPNNAGDLTKGGTIMGNVGTIFEGYQFLYSGTGVEVANFNITQGVTDKIYNTLDEAIKVDTVTGKSIIQMEMEGLFSENVIKQNDIAKKTVEIAEYRERLVQKYSLLEAAVARANAMLMMLDMQMQSMGKK